jgi:hypothetical protein
MNSQTFEAHTMPTLCLTADQIADLLIADDPNALSLASRQRHLRDCGKCSAEFEQLELAIGGLRDSAKFGSAAAYAAVSPSMRSQRTVHYSARPIAPIKTHRGAWAMASAIVILLVTLPFASHRPQPSAQGAGKGTNTSSPAIRAPLTDEALMEGINQDLSVSVPSSLQPLADPATSDGGSPVTDDGSTMR